MATNIWSNRYLFILKNRRSVITLLSCLIGIGIFYLSDYSFFCNALSNLIAILLTKMKISTIQEGNIFIIGNSKFEITSECTYLDWFFLATPFIWRYRSILSDIKRTVALFVAVSFFNIVRIVGVALVFTKLNWSWYWCHDFLDYWTYYGTFVIIICLWFRAMRSQLIVNKL